MVGPVAIYSEGETNMLYNAVATCNSFTKAPNNQPQEGRKTMAMDVAWGGQSMDLMSPEGFIGAIYHACRLKPGTGGLAAPVCSSFVYLFLGLKANLGFHCIT